LKGYGEHWQFSIFFCVLKDIDRVRLQSDIEAQINLKEDQTMIIDMGSDEKEAREAAVILGQSLPEIENRIIVI
jgi:CRISPR-associated protein Cas2